MHNAFVLDSTLETRATHSIMEAQQTACIFTCITCRVSFTDADMQRAHYKTDWHRYNLKRKVAQMPPITAELFFERLMSQRAKVKI